MEKKNVHIIGEKIRSIRKSKGMTLKDLGGVLGLSVSAVSAIERGDTTPTAPVLLVIARLGEVTLDELITGKIPANYIAVSELETLEYNGKVHLSNYEQMLVDDLRAIDPKYQGAVVEVVGSIRKQHPIAQPVSVVDDELDD